MTTHDQLDGAAYLPRIIVPKGHDREQYRHATGVSALTHDACSAKVLTARVRVAPRVATTVEHRDPATKRAISLNDCITLQTGQFIAAVTKHGQPSVHLHAQ